MSIENEINQKIEEIEKLKKELEDLRNIENKWTTNKWYKDAKENYFYKIIEIEDGAVVGIGITLDSDGMYIDRSDYHSIKCLNEMKLIEVVIEDVKNAILEFTNNFVEQLK